MPLSPVFAVSRSFPSLSWRAVGLCVVAFRLFPSRSSRLDIQAGGRGGDVCFVVCGLSRGVVLRGWRGVLLFPLGGSFPTVREAGRFGWFFHMELLGGLFVRSDAEAKRFI